MSSNRLICFNHLDEDDLCEVQHIVQNAVFCNKQLLFDGDTDFNFMYSLRLPVPVAARSMA